MKNNRKKNSVKVYHYDPVCRRMINKHKAFGVDPIGPVAKLLIILYNYS